MTERELFSAAVEIVDPRERAAYVASATAGDPSLRNGVEALLRAHDDAGSFLERSPLEQETQCGPAGSKRGPAGLAATTIAAADSGLEFLTPSDDPGVLGTLDHYEVLSICGRGGMGIVLKAHDPRLKRIVALKVLAPEFAANATARKRFLREAQAAAAVAHPHVVTIYAVEEGRPLSLNASGSALGPQRSALPYLVMEYIAGQTLRDKIEREGTLALPAILRIGSQIAAGLAAAHKQGLIHRDIKPANVLLENGIERVKLTDFGLARAVDDVSVTRTGEVAGTPQYMSPEQAQGHAVDHRSDLFSLGSVLYTMCTGRPPFRGETVVSVIRRVCDESPRPVREVNPDVPAWLADTIARLLAKDPGKRIQSAGEVAEILGAELANLRAGVPSSTQIAPRVATSLRSQSRARRWLPAAALIALLVLTLGTTEATGVTNFAGTIIRIVRGDGTLVISVDDPEVSVSIDGDDLVITGAGPKEIRVAAGDHRLTFTKDGRPIDQKLVTVTRGGRQIVTATYEPGAAGEASPAGGFIGNGRNPLERGDARPAIDVESLVQDLHQRYPEAQLGLMLSDKRLAITGRPASPLQADAIRGELNAELMRRFPGLVKIRDGAGAIDPDKLTLVYDLHVRPLAEQLARLARALVVGQQPSWSPDGTQIIYTRNDVSGLEIVDVATRKSRTYVESKDMWENREFGDPAWSPDGRDILFSSRPAKGGFETEQVWLMSVEEPNLGGEMIAPGGYPAWAGEGPDDQPLIFLTSRGETPARLKSRMRTAGDVPLTDYFALPSLYSAISPDGRRVATSAGNTLQIRSLETGAVEQKWNIDIPASGMILNWSPDSRYVSIAPFDRDYHGLWMYDTAEQQGGRIIAGPVKGAVWSPDGQRIALDTAGREGGIWIIDLPDDRDLIESLTSMLSGVPPQADELEADIARVVRVVRGELSDDERKMLLAEQHPIFGQLADPNTKPMLELFANLKPGEQAMLRQAGYLKWKYSNLPAERQKVYRQAVEASLDMARTNGTTLPDTMSLEALEKAEVGFARIDISEKHARVLSWFILFPEHPAPVWVTVVNARHAGTPEYFAAHNAQLNALRLKPVTPSTVSREKQSDEATAQAADEPTPSEELVRIAEEELAKTLLLKQRGAVSAAEVERAKVELLQAKIAVAKEHDQREEVDRLLQEIIKSLESRLEYQQRLRERAAVSAAEVEKARVDLLEARITMAKERGQRDEVERLYDDVIKSLENRLEFQKQLWKRGAASIGAVWGVEKEILRQRQLRQAVLESID